MIVLSTQYRLHYNKQKLSFDALLMHSQLTALSQHIIWHVWVWRKFQVRYVHVLTFKVNKTLGWCVILVIHWVALFPEISIVFFRHFEKKRLWSFTPFYFFNYKQGSWIYESYIHSRIMYVLPMKRTWKDNSNHTKYTKTTYGFIEIRLRLNICQSRWNQHGTDDICTYMYL